MYLEVVAALSEVLDQRVDGLVQILCRVQRGVTVMGAGVGHARDLRRLCCGQKHDVRSNTQQNSVQAKVWSTKLVMR